DAKRRANTHSRRRSRALAIRARASRRAGKGVRDIRRAATTPRISAVAEPRKIIVGSRVEPKAVRNRASRVARPAMSNDTTAAEVRAAKMNGWESAGDERIWLGPGGGINLCYTRMSQPCHD